MYQDITITGRLAADPELKEVGDSKVCSFTVMTNTYAGKGKDDQVQAFRVNVWGGPADAAASMLQKGTLISAQGPIRVSGREHNGKIYTNVDVRARSWQALAGMRPKQESAASGSSSKPSLEDIPF